MLRFLPTPIGNLDDISHRTLAALRDCEVVICEDTRVSKSLICLLNSKFNLAISPQRFFSLNSHNAARFFAQFDGDELREMLVQKNCVFLSDAGMPCISDPGGELVRFAQTSGVPYEVYSGANALLLAIAASGLIEKEFIFLGFLHEKNPARAADISRALAAPYPCVIYESPRRVLQLVAAFERALRERGQKRRVFLIKEATKRFETKFFGEIGAVGRAETNGDGADGKGWANAGGADGAVGVGDPAKFEFGAGGEILASGSKSKNSEVAAIGANSESAFLRELRGANLNGEWVVVLAAAPSASAGEPITEGDIAALDIAPKAKAKLIAKLRGIPAKDAYAEILRGENGAQK